MWSRRLCLMVSVSLLLSACTSQTRITGDILPRDQSWSLLGKLGVSAGSEHGNFTVDWQQRADGFEINLLGPLGIGVARVSGDADSVLLQVPGREPLSAASADDLLYEALGLNIPVSQMRYWVRGTPAPGRYRSTATGFQQLGWTIEYLRYEQALPARLRASRPEVKLTMAIRQWTN